MSSFVTKTLRLLPTLIALMVATAYVSARAQTSPQAEKRAAAAIVAVNVFGTVERPGTHQLGGDATLLSALGAAGGWKVSANKKKISIVRGPPGEKPVVTFHDVDAILRGDVPNPKVQDHDTVFVPEPVF